LKYRQLGVSDLQVPVISLGSWLTYSGGVEKRQATACLHKALDLGINFFDTANVYGRGAAESVLGEALHGIDRTSYMLATKVFGAMSNTDRGLSRAQIVTQLDASLKRLGTDYIDLYQCHRFDEETPLDETMEALTRPIVRARRVILVLANGRSPRSRRRQKCPASRASCRVSRNIRCFGPFRKTRFFLVAPNSASARSSGRRSPRGC
jgi:aryl-alcohol dehydrogenase-like predicted oxidoreductase